MRYLIATLVFCLLWTAGVSLLPKQAHASESNDFIGWALTKSRDLDSRWDTISGPQTARASGRRGVSETGSAISLTGRRSCRGRSGGIRSHVSSSGFIHKAKYEFRPINMKKRGSPIRGVTKMTSPAQARLNIRGSRRHPINLQMKRMNFTNCKRSFSRPHMKRFGRMSNSSRRNRSFTRSSLGASRTRRRR